MASMGKAEVRVPEKKPTLQEEMSPNSEGFI